MDARAPVNPRTLLTWLGLGFGVAGLVLQFILSMQMAFANGRDILGFLGHFFAYYTILTNMVLVLIYLSEVLTAPGLNLFRHPVLRGLMTANIALVALYVFFVLRFLSAQENLLLLADTILHYLCPVLYLLWWLLQPHGKLRWSGLPMMLAPTLAYFVYVLARGAWVQEYPYPFMNAIKLGYGAVLQGALLMAAALAVLSATIIGLDHLLGRSRTAVDA